MAQSHPRINELATAEESDLKLKAKEDHVATTKRRYDRFRLIAFVALLISMLVMMINAATWPDPLPGQGSIPQNWQGDLFDLSLMGVFFSLVFLVFLNQPSFLCPYCGKHVRTDEDWMCGYCDTVNKKNWLGLRSHMLHTCGKCNNGADSIVCHHCKSRVCLSERRDDQHPAQRVTKSSPTPSPLVPPVRKMSAAPVVVLVDPVKEQLETLKREKQKIDQETEIMNARIALATAESRYTEAKSAKENRFKDVIARMLQPLEDKRQRREALMTYAQNTRQAIDARQDLNDEQKAKLKEELSIDIEQAALEDA
jgi:hypothetical protein